MVLGFTLCWLTPPLGRECVRRNKINTLLVGQSKKSGFPHKIYIDYLSADSDFLMSPCLGLESCCSHD